MIAGGFYSVSVVLYVHGGANDYVHCDGDYDGYVYHGYTNDVHDGVHYGYYDEYDFVVACGEMPPLNHLRGGCRRSLNYCFHIVYT